MKLNNEITVRVTCSYEELHKELINNKFKIVDKYQVNDIYMVNEKCELNSMQLLDVIKNCIIIRDEVGIGKNLVYKQKEYSNNGDIIKQDKIECPIDDINKALNFMQHIGYQKVLDIYDTCIIYANDDIEIIVQLVNDKYIFIEMESEFNYINKQYDSIENMKKDLDSYNLPYLKDSYFVKKAEILLIDQMNIK